MEETFIEAVARRQREIKEGIKPMPKEKDGVDVMFDVIKALLNIMGNEAEVREVIEEMITRAKKELAAGNRT